MAEADAIRVPSHLPDEMKDEQAGHRDEDPLGPGQPERLRLIAPHELDEEAEDPGRQEVDLTASPGTGTLSR